MKNIRVIGGYKCGCTYGPVWQKDRLEYCGVHGDEIANEYDVSFISAPNKVLHADGATSPDNGLCEHGAILCTICHLGKSPRR